MFWTYLLTFFGGVLYGIFLIALVSANRRDDDED